MNDRIKNAADKGSIFANHRLFIGVFAFLVSNTAAGFASGLAGSLAFAAATVFAGFAKITSFKSFDSFHGSFSFSFLKVPYIKIGYYKNTIFYECGQEFQ